MKRNPNDEFKFVETPSAEDYERVSEIRSAALDFAKKIAEICPECREAGIALDKIREAFWWAKTAVIKPTR